MKAFKTTLIGGVLFLVPVVFLVIILDKAFQLTMSVAEPMDRLLPDSSIGGFALMNLIAILLIACLCFLAGLLARTAFLSRHVEKLDSVLIEAIPGYSFAKGMVGGMADAESAVDALRPVLIQLDDSAQIAFEIDRHETTVVVFLPGSPSPWSGATISVTADRVKPLDLPPHQVVSLIRVLGRGSAKPIHEASLKVTAPK